MESTTHSRMTNEYSERRLREYVDRRKWNDAFKECDGLLNGNDRSYFQRADIWVTMAIINTWLNKHDSAAHCMAEAKGCLGMTPELTLWFLRNKQDFHSVRGHVGQSDAAVLAIEELAPVGDVWMRIRFARVRVNAATLGFTTRGKKHELLDDAERLCRDADSILAGTDSTDLVLANLKVWFLAAANQSDWNHTKVARQLIDRIAELAPDDAARLRKQLRWKRRWLGLHIHA